MASWGSALTLAKVILSRRARNVMGEYVDLLRQNWAWIASNPWAFAAFVVVAFGFGWGAARLFYSERIELLKLKASASLKAPSAQESAVKFQYRATGRHGPNLLGSATHDVKVGQHISFQADVPQGEKLHVVLHGPPIPSLGASSAAWYFNVVGVVNWVASTYQESTSSPVQHFNAEAGLADMQFYFGRAGDVFIEVFEGESTEATWSKSIRVHADNAA